MRNIFFVSATVLTIFLTACSPEDGFCYKEEYRGSNNFACSEMNSYFSKSGEEVNIYYTSKVLIYRDTLLAKSSMMEGVNLISIEKPEYIPKALPLEKMVKCTIAPENKGMTCNEWLSFEFESIEGVSVTFSTRDRNKFSNELTLQFATLKLKEISLKGTVQNNEMSFKETILIDNEKIEVVHRYSLYHK